MSARIIFEVKQSGGKIDLRLTNETTANVTEKEQALAKMVKDVLDEFLGCVKEAAAYQGVKFSHTKEGA